MNVKNFLICGLVAGIADFLLGWLTYGFLFKDFFGAQDPDMRFVVLGCFGFGFLFSLLFTKADIRATSSGVMYGALLGFLYSVTSESFMRSSMPIDKMILVTDVGIMTATGAVIGVLLAAFLARKSKRVA